jgi:hypothetical protein
MRRTLLAAITCVCAVGCLVASLVLLSSLYVNRKSGQTIVLNGVVTDTSRVNAEALEGEVRRGLPIGSQLSMVEAFLTKRTIEHSFDPSSETVYAIVRNITGGSIGVGKSIAFQFHFDDSMKLQAIDAKVVYTGS